MQKRQSFLVCLGLLAAAFGLSACGAVANPLGPPPVACMSPSPESPGVYQHVYTDPPAPLLQALKSPADVAALQASADTLNMDPAYAAGFDFASRQLLVYSDVTGFDCLSYTESLSIPSVCFDGSAWVVTARKTRNVYYVPSGPGPFVTCAVEPLQTSVAVSVPADLGPLRFVFEKVTVLP